MHSTDASKKPIRQREHFYKDVRTYEGNRAAIHHQRITLSYLASMVPSNPAPNPTNQCPTLPPDPGMTPQKNRPRLGRQRQKGFHDPCQSESVGVVLPNCLLATVECPLVPFKCLGVLALAAEHTSHVVSCFEGVQVVIA